MSQYIQFFISTDKQHFYPVAEYPRNSYIYHWFEGQAPYEKVRALKQNSFDDIFAQIRCEREQIQEQIKYYTELPKQIISFNNDVEEKLQALRDAQDSLDEYRDKLDDNRVSGAMVAFLASIISTAKTYEGVDGDNYLYVGIECGDIPEVELE